MRILLSYRKHSHFLHFILLVHHFYGDYGTPVETMLQTLTFLLINHHYPGNIWEEAIILKD